MSSVCAVCAPGYGGGVVNACHECTDGFKTGAYIVVSFASILVLVVAALLSVYLVSGVEWESKPTVSCGAPASYIHSLLYKPLFTREETDQIHVPYMTQDKTPR